MQRQWKDDFRMSRKTFESIVEIVRPKLQKQNTQLRNAIPIKKRFLQLFGDQLRVTLTELQGKRSESENQQPFLLHMIFTKNFLEILEDLFVFRNQEVKLAVQSRIFKEETNCKIPQANGAIDCTHIKILPPANEGKKDYFSRKQCHTINTEAVIGANLKILDLATGFPGSIHDARALRKTSIYRKAENNEILSHPLRQNNDVNV